MKPFPPESVCAVVLQNGVIFRGLLLFSQLHNLIYIFQLTFQQNKQKYE